MTMPFILPSAEDLDKEMENPYEQVNVRPTPESVTSLVGRALLQGHTMLAGSCNSCNTVLMRNPLGAEYCVYCQMRQQNNLSQNQPTALMPAPEPVIQQAQQPSHDQPQPTMPPPLPEAILAQRRERRSRIANYISEALTNGHAMLDTVCPTCHTVLLRYAGTCVRCLFRGLHMQAGSENRVVRYHVAGSATLRRDTARGARWTGARQDRLVLRVHWAH